MTTMNQAIYKDLYKIVIKDVEITIQMHKVIQYNEPFETFAKILKNYGHEYMNDLQDLLNLREEYIRRPKYDNFDEYGYYANAVDNFGDKMQNDVYRKKQGEING